MKYCLKIFYVVLFLLSVQVFARESYFKPSAGEVVADSESLEQILTSPSGGVSLFSGAGDLLPGFPAWANDHVFVSSPIVTDIDGNGTNEIVVVGRSASDVYTIYAYNGTGQIIALLPINGTIYYDPTAVSNGAKNDILVSTSEGDVIKFEYQGNNFVSDTIFAPGVPAAISSDAGDRLYVVSPQKTSIDIYLKNTWAFEKSITVENPIIYPVAVDGEAIYGVTNAGGLTAVNRVTGQQIIGFPLTFSSFAIDSPQIVEIEPAAPGLEIVLQFSDGSRKVVSQAGSVLSTELTGKGFSDSSQFVTTAKDNDLDGDGVTNAEEYLLGTYPNNPDTDNDGVLDGNDAFPTNPNETNDNDHDGIGDNADPDDDNDGVPDTNDAFPFDPKESGDTDGDGLGNNIDPDDDNDGVPDNLDKFPLDPTESIDTDGDKIGNNADPDDDNDGVLDVDDNCELVKNADQADLDDDGFGNACDNCPKVWNDDQLDADNNGIGDVCDGQGTGNNPPEINNVVLSSPSHQGDEDLTLSYELTDADGDAIKKIYAWKVNDLFAEALNLPFESGASDSKATKDYSGNGLQADVYGPTWNAIGGHDGFGAYEFDYGQYMQLGNNDALNFGTSDFSISAWVYHKDYTYPRTTFAMRKSNGACYVDGSVGFDIGHVYKNYGSQFCLNDGTNKLATRLTFDVGSRPTDFINKWVHLVYVFDRTNGRFKAYVNGVKQTNEINISSVTGSISGNSPLYIGMVYGWYLSGTLDDLAIYKRALSGSQIVAIFNGEDKITKEEAKLDEKWQVCVTPNDGIVDGIEGCSNEFSVYNNQPTQDTPVLSHLDNYDLGLTLENVQDGDADNVLPIIDWRNNDTSIAVLDMPFEGTESPDIVKDYSTFGNSGKVFGATWIKNGGYNGFGAYEFDGTDDYIEIPDADSLDKESNGMSISLWVKTTDTSGTILSKRSYANSSGVGYSYELSSQGWGGTSYFMFQDGTSNNGWQYAYASTNVADGNWHHVVGILNRSEGTIRVYVDGKECSKPVRSVPGFGSMENQVNLKLGNKTFSGSLDDVKIFNRALTAQQIANLFNGKNEIAKSEFSEEDDWKACVTLNDGVEDAANMCTNSISLANDPPTHDEPLLTLSADGNLMVTPQNTADLQGDAVFSEPDWLVNGQSFALLNMPFDDGLMNTSTVTDYSLNENIGQLVNASYSPAGGVDDSGAYEFDGSPNQYIKIPNLHPSDNAYTISVWIKPAPHTQRELFFNFGGLSGLQFSEVRPDNKILHYHGANPFTYMYTTQKVNIDEWNHFVVTWDGTKMKAYINGVLDPAVQSGNAPVVMNNDTHIGSFAASYPYKGAIDNVLLFGKALTSKQIQSIYQAGYSTIVNEETVPGQTWQGCIVPTDGKENGERKCATIVP